MVAYFRLQNNLFMAIGFLAGIGAAVLSYQAAPGDMPVYTRAFALLLFAFGGLIAGRIFSSLWAFKKLRSLYDIIEVKDDPEKFIETFTSMVEGVPKHTIEYINGVCQLAFAWEAMGKYEEGLRVLKYAEPEQLGLHRLIGCSLISNQRLRLFLLKKDRIRAEEECEKLRSLRKQTQRRAPAIYNNLNYCLKLYGIWLDFLNGNEIGEKERRYMEEEIQLAKNRIYRREMECLLEQMKEKK